MDDNQTSSNNLELGKIEIYDENKTQYSYKCPGCKGEFNSPSYGQGGSTSHIPYARCPWCGKRMEGLNQ